MTPGVCAPPVMLRHFGKGGEGYDVPSCTIFVVRQGTDLANAGLSRASESEGRVCGLPMGRREGNHPNELYSRQQSHKMVENIVISRHGIQQWLCDDDGVTNFEGNVMSLMKEDRDDMIVGGLSS